MRIHWMFYFWICCMSVMAASIIGTNAEQSADVTGCVFLDQNKNGQKDQDEKGIPDIYVSDGEKIIKTGPDGRYAFKGMPVRECAFVILPENYSPVKDFFVFVDTNKIDANIALYHNAQGKEHNFAFIQSGDIQMLESVKDKEKACRELFGKLEDISRKNDVRFYICAGDLTLFGNMGDLEAIKKVTDESERRFWPCFGGHDGLDKTMKYPKTGNYKQVFGPLAYSWNYGGVHFIVMIAEKQFLSANEKVRMQKWLRNDIALLPDGANIVLTGHLASLMKEEIDELKGKHAVIAILQGHVHAHAIYNTKETPVICSGPWRPLDWGAGTIKARIINVRDGKIKTETIPFINTFSAPERDTNAPAVILSEQENWNSFSGPAGKRSVDLKMNLPLKLAWKVSLGKFQPFPAGTPIICNKKVYVGIADPDFPAQKAGVVCIDAEKGNVLWRTPLDEAIYSPVAAYQGRIFALGGEGTLWALDADTGKIIWSTSIYDHTAYSKDKYVWHQALAPVVAEDGRIFVALAKYNAAIESESGKIVWTQEAGTEEYSATAGLTVGKKMVYSINNDGVAALDIKTGGVLWQKKLLELGAQKNSDRGISTPIHDGDAIYFPHRVNIAKVNESNGNILWNFTNTYGSMNSIASPALAGGKLVLARGTNVFALSASAAAAGGILWKFNTRSYNEAGWGFGDILINASSPAIAGDKVLVGGDDGYFYVLALNDGKKLQEIRMGSPIKSSPACAGNLVCITDFNGNLYGFTWGK